MPSNTKKVLHVISSIVLYSILAIIGIIIIMFIAYFVDQKIGMKNGEDRAPLFGAYVIVSPSMVPTIRVNDAVVTMRASENDIKVNDIITFISKDIQTQGTPITHRVVGIVYDEYDKTKVVGYRTKGDNNNTQDFAIIRPDEVRGKVILKIPFVGYIQRFLTTPFGWIVAIVIPCVLIIGNDILKIGKDISERDLTEEEKLKLHEKKQRRKNRGK